MNRRATAGTTLGLAGAALALGVLFLHVPAALWAGNVAEHQFGYWPFLGLGVCALLAGLALAALLLYLMPPRMRAVAASAAGAVGVVWWVYGLLLVPDLPVLDGISPPITGADVPGIWELAVVIALTGLLGAAMWRHAVTATRTLLLLNAALVVASAVAVLSAPPRTWDAGDVAQSSVFRFSADVNVLVALLDGLQSNVAESEIRSDPAIAAALDGFALYRDTLGVAPTTFLSMPAIHSGMVYPGHGDPGTYFSGEIARHSFMTRFADAGYDATLINAIAGVCPDRVHCTTATQLLGATGVRLRNESLRLLDLSLFRIAPFHYKPAVYGDGRWVARRALGFSDDAEQVLEGSRVFDRMAQGLTVDHDAPPTLKFIHSFATHTPYVLDARCVAGPTHISRVGTQAHCALEAVGHLLDRMKRAGVYDNTVILLIADHGLNAGLYAAAPTDSPEGWEHLRGSANPLFMLKPLRGHGAFHVDAAPVSLADVGATLCASASACTGATGYPAGEAPPDRVRRFNQYEWRHEFWRTRHLPNLTAYEVHGPLDDSSSWRQAD